MLLSGRNRTTLLSVCASSRMDAGGSLLNPLERGSGLQLLFVSEELTVRVDEKLASRPCPVSTLPVAPDFPILGLVFGLGGSLRSRSN